MATARCPCLGRGHGPAVLVTRFHFNMGAAILKFTHNAIRTREWGEMPGCSKQQKKIVKSRQHAITPFFFLLTLKSIPLSF